MTMIDNSRYNTTNIASGPKFDKKSLEIVVHNNKCRRLYGDFITVQLSNVQSYHLMEIRSDFKVLLCLIETSLRVCALYFSAQLSKSGKDSKYLFGAILQIY